MTKLDSVQDSRSILKNRLLSGRVLARNSLWNFSSMTAPLLVGLFAIPYLILGLGKERFGLLAIIWMGVGYFSLFDMGLGRALTKLVAERLGRDENEDLPEIIWTALCLILGLGAVGTVCVFLLSEPLIVHLLNVPLDLVEEGITSFRLLAVSLPVVIATSSLVGILEAHQRFAKIAAVRLPLGVMTFLGPVLSLQFSPSLVGATVFLIAARGIAFFFYYMAAAQVSPSLKHPEGITRRHLRPLLSFGGWLTATNIVGPLMVYFDRFFIGATMTMTAVAYYVTPYDALSRLQMLPQSIMGVVFPALATAAASDRARLPNMYGKTSRILFLLMLPLTSSAFLFAPEGLQLWLGEEFRAAATPVVHWLSLGWMINTLARPPFTVLQSIGRPDLVGKTHLLELIPYIVALWLLAKYFGITGVAIAWFCRVLVDTVVLNELARRQLPELSSVIWGVHLMVASVVASFLTAGLIDSFIVRALLFIAVSTVSGLLVWPTIRTFRLTGRDLERRAS